MTDFTKYKSLAEFLDDTHAMTQADIDAHNAEQRLLITDYASEHPTAHLGKFNLYSDTIPANTFVLTPYQPGMTVYNFGADFIIPQYDEQLNQMIIDRHATPYTGTADDYKLLTEITNRIDALHGKYLFWR